MRSLHTSRGLVLACLLAPLAALACGEGRVFEDANGDGLRQSRERALAGVRVSDGTRVVATAGDGRWQGLAPGADGHVFVIKPASHAVGTGPDGLPAFWRRGDGEGAACEIGLRRQAVPRAALKLIVSSDPQAGTAAETEYYARIVERAMRPHRDAALGLTLGDIANDALDLYPALNRATAALGIPWLHVAGNHDLDAGAGDDHDSLATFRAVFGPDTLAWEEPEAMFVLLDNVIARPGQRPAYVGGLREAQFGFLAQVLEGLDPGRLLVVATHIPWFDTAAAGRAPSLRLGDRARLFQLLQAHPKLLLLTGHRHAQRRFLHGAGEGWHGAAPLQEFNVGAMSGAYWSGVADAEGIPLATMADGTPRGFATLRIARDGTYRIAWHPTVVAPADPAFTDAMALHAPRVLRRGAYPAWGVYANVFLGHAGTRVDYRIGEGTWTPMQQVLAPDPRLLLENARDDLAPALRSYDRSPEAEVSHHLWRGALDTRRDAGAHRVEVRAVDPDGSVQQASVVYRLEEAAP